MTRTTRRQRDFRRAKSYTMMLTISAILFSGAHAQYCTSAESVTRG